MNISAIILAAGCAKRMGKPKQLLPVHGKPMFLHSVEMALEADLSPIHVIGGEHSYTMRDYISEMPVRIIFNKNYTKGMSSSLKIGIESVKEQSEATVLFLGDQPLTPPVVVQKIVQSYMKYRDKGFTIVRPKYGGYPGHPILIDSCLFEEFCQIEGDQGGKSIIQKYYSSLKWENFDNVTWGMDVDTPDDYKKI